MWTPGPEILTVSQHAEIDRLAGLSGTAMQTLMENAGRQVANEIAKRWSRRKVAVLCGPGNNGGDGFVVARHLEARGWPVEVVRVGDHKHASHEASAAARAWTGPIGQFSPGEPIHGDLVVDAIFGAGLSRALPVELSSLFADIGTAEIPVVAIDVPSGIHGDQARFLGDARPWTATLCVTFFRHKPAHILYPARQYCGDTVVTDIGIGDGLLGALARLPLQDADSLVRCDEIRPPFKIPPLEPTTHKYRRGHCLVVSGPASMTGAARLSAHAALRAGAGLVTVVGDEQAMPVLAAQLTSIMVRPLLATKGLGDVLTDARITCVVVGPGAGYTPATRKNVLDTLASRRPCVIDADGLSCFSERPADLFSHLHAMAVLTPHEGEFERLFPGLLSRSTNRIEATRAAARLSRAVVLLKGADTVVASAEGDAAVNTNAPPDLATAGAGDVLAGIVGGLMAQGIKAYDAAKTAAFLHGECGRLAGRGLIAEDLPGLLPKALETAAATAPRGL